MKFLTDIMNVPSDSDNNSVDGDFDEYGIAVIGIGIVELKVHIMAVCFTVKIPPETQALMMVGILIFWS